MSGFHLSIRAMLFDMDGVLLDSRRVVERTWQRWSERHGLAVEPFLRIAHGRRSRDTLRAVAPALATDEEVAWLDAAELADLDIRPIPGARELVASLPAARWTIVTSAGRELARLRLQAVGLELPDNAVTSEDVARGKPAPDGYLLALERLEVPVARCLVVEDTPAGIQAGKAAGARVLAVATTHSVDQLQGADFLVPDWRVVRATMEAESVLLHIDSWSSTISSPRSTI